MPLDDDGQCAVHMIRPTDPVTASVEAVGFQDPQQAPGAPPRAPGWLGGVLMFSWGPMVVGVDEVYVGRDPEIGEFARRIDRFDTVSRRHAVLWRRTNLIFVRDLASTNGTFVNERRLAPHVAHQLHAGDVVRFGVDLRARVGVADDDNAE
jgi:hypothetical protein